AWDWAHWERRFYPTRLARSSSADSPTTTTAPVSRPPSSVPCGPGCAGGPEVQTESALGVAVIVPVLHDTEAFCRLCAAIEEWRVKPQEVMVVSGAADEKLERRCRERGYRYVEAAAIRGMQLDVGARATQA